MLASLQLVVLLLLTLFTCSPHTPHPHSPTTPPHPHTHICFFCESGNKREGHCHVHKETREVALHGSQVGGIPLPESLARTSALFSIISATCGLRDLGQGSHQSRQTASNTSRSHQRVHLQYPCCDFQTSQGSQIELIKTRRFLEQVTQITEIVCSPVLTTDVFVSQKTFQPKLSLSISKACFFQPFVFLIFSLFKHLKQYLIFGAQKKRQTTNTKKIKKRKENNNVCVGWRGVGWGGVEVVVGGG